MLNKEVLRNRKFDNWYITFKNLFNNFVGFIR